jgi:hypothetical protein
MLVGGNCYQNFFNPGEGPKSPIPSTNNNPGVYAPNQEALSFNRCSR